MLSYENKLQPSKIIFYPKSYKDNDLFKKNTNNCKLF